MKKNFVLFCIGIFACAFLTSCDRRKSQEGASGATGRMVQQDESKGVISIDCGENLDMGKVFEASLAEGSFTIKNISEKVQTVISVEPTCKCIKVKQEVDKILLQPGEELKIDFVLDVVSVSFGSFTRMIDVYVKDAEPIRVQVLGEVLFPLTFEPEREFELGMFKDPATKWSRTVSITVAPELVETLELGEPVCAGYLSAQLKKLEVGKYELTVEDQKTMPYARNLEEQVILPILKPEKARFSWITISAQVGEAVNFAPDNWKIVRSKLEEAGQFTERFAYGEVPGLQEEKNDGVRDLRNMMKKSLLRQHNAVPLKFVKENHDWDDLFAHLEYEVPAGVTLEKIRHPQGIELKITVTKEAFAEATSVQVVPFRDGNRCSPITIQVVD